MIQAVRRRAAVYGAMAAIVPKVFLAYSLWFWIGLILRLIAITMYVFFWRAIYAGTDEIAGLALQQTLNFILFAQIFEPLTDSFLLFEFGYNLREGAIAHALLRPMDLQTGYYAQALAQLVTGLFYQIPMAVVATLLFGLRWPADPALWAAFVITALLGHAVMFFFNWCLACLTFYTTEVWGLAVLISGIGLFAGGSLVPLVMMPDWLQILVRSLPFAQALYVPLSLLSGITPLAQAPVLWLEQLAWLVGLGVLSRLFFRVAVRRVTVHGG